ncbi:MAG TPA: SLC13 family permease [Saprospiraceae bacterium]|nr:SLC13 family permease [Saprospiraceae bacterium]HMQ83390.1 SLC13 family permease [Saprospiraceae bacterium]
MSTIWSQLKPFRFAILLILLFVVIDALHLAQHSLQLTRPEELTLTILLITAVLWITEAVPLYVTSLGVLAMSLLWLTPVLEKAGQNIEEAIFFQAFFGDITLLFMGGFVISALLNKYGLAHRLANWIIHKTGSEPSRVLLGLIVVSALLSMWISNTATAAMMFAIITPVVMQYPNAPFSKALVLSIPFACNIGGLGTPIGTPPNAIAIGYLQQAGFNITFAGWMLFAVPFVVLMLYLLWRMLLRSYPSEGIEIKLELQQYDPGFSPNQKAVLLIFSITILGWLSSGFTGISTGVVGLLVIILTFGTGLLKTPDFRNISWDILFMLGGGLCLGAALTASGLTKTIAEAIPLGTGFWPILTLLMVLGALMSTFMSNTATANLLVPIAVSITGNEMIFAIVISVMCSSAMALPISTPPNAIAFGSGLLQAKDMFIRGITITIMAFVLAFAAIFIYKSLL